MCIQVRVTYQRCSHVHLGYELCPEFNPSDGFCPGFETHPRIDPFCPLCSKLDYRAYKVQLGLEIKAQQYSEAMIVQTGTMVHPVQSQFFGQLQSQARHDFGNGEQKVTDESKTPSVNRSASDSFLYSEIHSLKPHSTPPSPIEPPIDPGLLGPHQFLEYRQRLATVIVADHRPKLGQQDRRNS